MKIKSLTIQLSFILLWIQRSDYLILMPTRYYFIRERFLVLMNRMLSMKSLDRHLNRWSMKQILRNTMVRSILKLTKKIITIDDWIWIMRRLHIYHNNRMISTARRLNNKNRNIHRQAYLRDTIIMDQNRQNLFLVFVNNNKSMKMIISLHLLLRTSVIHNKSRIIHLVCSKIYTNMMVMLAVWISSK